MLVRSAKNKGMKFQKEIVNHILSIFEDLTHRDVRSIPSSVSGTDIWLSEKASKRIPLDVEAKCQESLNIWAAIKQVEDRCPKDKMPVVIFKRNRTNPYVCIGLDNFLTMLERCTSE